MSYFTEGLFQVLNQAKEISKKYKLKYIGTEVLVYSILLTGSCDAHSYLTKFGANKENFFPHFKKSMRNLIVDDFTPNANYALHRARDISMSYKLSYVSTEHLLLAILEIVDCMASKIFRALGVDGSSLYAYVCEQIKARKAQNNSINGMAPVKNVPLNSSYNDESLNVKSPLTSLNDVAQLKGLGYDLTQRAKDGKIDQIIGRDSEIERIIQTLSRKTKNNPVLVGEAGVGKSAVVEGLALKIISSKVPEFLKDKRIFVLDLSSLLAGTRYRGDFEEKFKKTIDYIIQNGNIILFIDEIHNLVGAGKTQDGVFNAGEILKPIIARGDLMLIGATTYSEYSKYIEKDGALERRFQPIFVEEPSIEDSIKILRGIKPSFERHHKIVISDEAIQSAVKLSKRYITNRYLPDKAIDLIDEASSKKRVQQTQIAEKLLKIEDEIKKLCAERDYKESRGDLDGAKSAAYKIDNLVSKLENEKRTVYDKRANTLVVTEDDIKSLISVWTKIPITTLTTEESDRLLSLEDELVKKVVGQYNAIETVCRAVRRSRTNLKDPNKPIGSFLFVGPTGVGKSQLSKALAECVFGSPNALIRFDMSEYVDKTSINKLIGSPAGYVGYEEDGVLTEKIRKNPYSVVLFDEIEKANDEVFDLLLQVLDEGRLTDSKGRLCSFKNALIILTSNLGASNDDLKKSVGFGVKENALQTSVLDAVNKRFRPEFINRLDDIIVFNSLTKNDCLDIADIEANILIKRLNESGIFLTIDNSAMDYIVEVGYSETFGARPIKRAISKHIEDLLSDAIIDGDVKKGDKINVYFNGEKITYKRNT